MSNASEGGYHGCGGPHNLRTPNRRSDRSDDGPGPSALRDSLAEKKAAYGRLVGSLEKLSVKQVVDFRRTVSKPSAAVEKVFFAVLSLIAQVDQTLDVNAMTATWAEVLKAMRSPGHFIGAMRRFPYAVDSGRISETTVQAVTSSLESLQRAPEVAESEHKAVVLAGHPVVHPVVQQAKVWLGAATAYHEVVSKHRAIVGASPGPSGGRTSRGTPLTAHKLKPTLDKPNLHKPSYKTGSRAVAKGEVGKGPKGAVFRSQDSGNTGPTRSAKQGLSPGPSPRSPNPRSPNPRSPSLRGSTAPAQGAAQRSAQGVANPDSNALRPRSALSARRADPRRADPGDGTRFRERSAHDASLAKKNLTGSTGTRGTQSSRTLAPPGAPPGASSFQVDVSSDVRRLALGGLPDWEIELEQMRQEIRELKSKELKQKWDLRREEMQLLKRKKETELEDLRVWRQQEQKRMVELAVSQKEEARSRDLRDSKDVQLFKKEVKKIQNEEELRLKREEYENSKHDAEFRDRLENEEVHAEKQKGIEATERVNVEREIRKEREKEEKEDVQAQRLQERELEIEKMKQDLRRQKEELLRNVSFAAGKFEDKVNVDMWF